VAIKPGIITLIVGLVVIIRHTHRSMWGLDSAYTTAWKTFKMPDGIKLDRDVFFETYHRVAKEFVLKNRQNMAVSGLPEGKYVVLHVRGMDKPCPLSEFDTVNVLTKLPSELTIVAISDNDTLLESIISNQSISRLHIIKLSDVKLDKYEVLFHDLRILMAASGIVQHSSNGWSAYSSTAAMIREIPLINTWIGRPVNSDRQNLVLGTLAGFKRVGGVPEELQSANRADEILRWVQRVQNRPWKPEVLASASAVTSSQAVTPRLDMDTQDSVRFLIIIGPEGSSHSLMSEVFYNGTTYEMLQVADGGKELHTSLQRSLYNHWSVPGLFDFPCRPQGNAKEVFLRTVKNLKQMQRKALVAAANWRQATARSPRPPDPLEIVIPLNSVNDNAAGMGMC
jgi:hypothetical protein